MKVVGLDWLERRLSIHPGAPCLVVSGYSATPWAAAALDRALLA